MHRILYTLHVFTGERPRAIERDMQRGYCEKDNRRRKLSRRGIYEGYTCIEIEFLKVVAVRRAASLCLRYDDNRRVKNAYLDRLYRARETVKNFRPSLKSGYQYSRSVWGACHLLGRDPLRIRVTRSSSRTHHTHTHTYILHVYTPLKALLYYRSPRGRRNAKNASGAHTRAQTYEGRIYYMPILYGVWHRVWSWRAAYAPFITVLTAA